VIVIGEAPDETIRAISRTLGQPVPYAPHTSVEPGQALVWLQRTETPVHRLYVMPGRSEQRYTVPT